MEIKKFPLQWPVGWPRTAEPKQSRFGDRAGPPTIADAVNSLQHEIKLLTGNDEFVISTNLKYQASGLPYSGQKQPNDKGVAVYFNLPAAENGNGGPMVIACDSFRDIGSNIHAIALTIGALRGIKRWGASELLNRAFTGFRALPEQGIRRGWYEVLGVPETATVVQIKEAHRAKSFDTHPDHGGNVTMFDEVQKAYKEALNQFVK